MMKMYSVFVLITLYFLSSCTTSNDNQRINSKQFQKISVLESGVQLTADKEVFDIKSVVQVDSSIEAFIGEEMKVFDIKDEIYVVDRIYSVVKVFNKNGTLNRVIGKLGEGPGEYTRLFDVTLGNADSSLLFYSNDSHKIIEYDFQGGFIKKIEVPFFAYYFVNLPQSSKYFFYINHNSSEINEKKNLLVTDQNLKVTNKYFPYTKDEIPVIAFSGKIVKNEEGLLYANALEDTIYQIDQSLAISSKYVFDFGQFSCPIDMKDNIAKMTKNLPEKSYLESTFLENKKALAFSFTHKRKRIKGFWSKTSSKFVTSGKSTSTSLIHILSVPVGITENDYFISFIKPETLNAYLQDDKDYLRTIKVDFPDLYNKLIRIKEGDNPLIITYQLKI